MKKIFSTISLILIVMLGYSQSIQSLSKEFTLQTELNSTGSLLYSLSYKNQNLVTKGRTGFVLSNNENFNSNFSIVKWDTLTHRSSWQPVWGEVKEIKNQYRELAITLQQKSTNRILLIRFRLFDDGLGFRYEFPQQSNLQHFVVKDELTSFPLSGNHKAFWIPGDYDTNEYIYSTTLLSEIDENNRSKQADEISTRVAIPNAVQTPLQLKSKEELYINIHEAALVNYPAMNLEVNKQTFELKAHLVPDAIGNKAYLQTPYNTPWRTILASDDARELIASKTILNLNEPSTLENTSWIKPQKYVGIWWEMHVGTGTWHYSDQTNLQLDKTDWKSIKPNGRHAANTQNTKRYIDFAAQHGFDGVLVEGWNVGWEDWFGQWKENVFDFITPYPDFDVKALQEYAKSKNVKLIMHHETSGSVTNYERRMDEAYQFMKQNGYDAVKTGYVGKIIPRGEHHDGQWMVNHYNRVAQKTADYQIMLDAHEPVRPTGLHRTYPNWLACEAARGNEFNAWSIGNPPEHETILPFTRLIGGPMDYTPGIFEIKMDYYVSQRPFNNQSPNGFQVHTTLAKQLALYVTLYSPLQMAADIPDAYKKRLDAFQFIKDVAVDWDDTRVIEAEPGDYLTIARKAKGKDNWFIGAITDEYKRTSAIKLDFLDKGKTYVATLYQDAETADWKNNPMAYKIEKFIVNSSTILKVNLANGGGVAVSIMPASTNDLKQVKKYKK
ncbi:MAG: glycoside hydrolase family 97 protein [Cyclobacteriaceae bacterium]|jgi:hypothetical protein|nr:glycoside hydrolase family 97 protein [Cyclobacteriaceae bacterium]